MNYKVKKFPPAPCLHDKRESRSAAQGIGSGESRTELAMTLFICSFHSPRQENRGRGESDAAIEDGPEEVAVVLGLHSLSTLSFQSR